MYTCNKCDNEISLVEGVEDMEEIQAALMIAIAACSEIEYRFTSEFDSVRLRFVKEEGLRLFLQGVRTLSRLQVVVNNLEVIITYLD